MVARACRYLFRVFESFRMMKMNGDGNVYPCALKLWLAYVWSD
eukprot:jgi/Mesvir1/17600/Mv26498-RA.1